MKSEISIEAKGNFTEVRFDATINLGNYSSEKLGVTYSMAERENVFSVINLCKDVVYGRAVPETVEVKKEEPKKEVKAAVEKPKAATATKPKVTKAAKEEAEAAVDAVVAEEETKEEVAVEETVAEEVKEEPKKEKRVIAKAKATPYDRANESHKRLLSAFLDKSQPNWKSKEVIAKASKTSQLLSEAGEDFLDGDGVLLQSFKDKFLEQLRA